MEGKELRSSQLYEEEKEKLESVIEEIAKGEKLRYTLKENYKKKGRKE